MGKTEKEIFSKIAFVDYGYFYDTDNAWYYIHPGPFRVKYPLKLIANNLDNTRQEYEFLKQTDNEILNYIFEQYPTEDREFAKLLDDEEEKSVYFIKAIQEKKGSTFKLYDECRKIFSYFDDWVVVKSKDNIHCDGFIMKKGAENHIETIEWK